MNIRTLTENELADLATNVAALLAGTELTAIESHVRADLIAALGTKPADLTSQTAEVVVIDTEKKAAISTRNDIFDEVAGLVCKGTQCLTSGIGLKRSV